MATVVNPEADLPPRAGDETLAPAELERLSLFAKLTRPPSFVKNPGTIVLRKYRAGDVVCRQGAAGWTAFYILTAEDVLALRQNQLAAEAEARGRRAEVLRAEIARLEGQAAALKSSDDGRQDAARRAATAHLAVQWNADARPAGLFAKLKRAFTGGSTSGSGPRPRTIPVDGPSDIDASTLNAPMHEGELFGEMSCLTRSPRSATIVADRDCYMIEMLRVVLDQMQRDKGYKEQMDAVYRRRVLAGHLRRLSIFELLTDEQFATMAGKVELLNFEPGQVIFDEHDRSESIYLVRGGLVKVVKNISALIAPGEIPDANWPMLAAAIAEGEQNADAPRGAIWKLLGEAAHAVARAVAGGQALEASQRGSLRDGLNSLIKNRDLPGAFGKKTEDVVAAVGGDVLRAAAAGLAPDARKWTDLELRTFNRALLEIVFDGMISLQAAGPRRTLAYLARGDFLGEMGVVTGEPRSATCIAYDHPDNGQAIAAGAAGGSPPRVEVVRIREEDFRALADLSPAVAERVRQVVESRRAETTVRVETAAWDEDNPVRFSPDFEELGLIQGQKLMLIDLDRCTRCGDCVTACINTHRDGRTRLYLDGPRFGKYLVPLTCRECLDPVCMIGCPVGAIHRGDNGQILIRDWCIGCELCANQCPYGSIHMHDLLAPDAVTNSAEAVGDTVTKEVAERAVVCDLCSTLPGQQPACVSQCPHDAAIRIDARYAFPER